MGRNKEAALRYLFGRTVVRSFFRIAHRVSWIGAERVPRTGPAILAANHQSFYDPPLVGGGLDRRVVFLAWDHYMKKPLLGRLMRWYDAVPLDVTSSPAAALATLANALKEGRLCGIFPEGRRTEDGLLGRPWPGVGMLALRSGAPVIPVTILGAWQAWPRERKLPTAAALSVYYGEPMDADAIAGRRGSSRQRRAAVALQVMLRIADGFTALGQADLAEAARRRLVADRAGP